MWKGMASSHAAIVSKGRTARLEAVPFHKSHAARVLPQVLEAVPFPKTKTPIYKFFGKL